MVRKGYRGDGSGKECTLGLRRIEMVRKDVEEMACECTLERASDNGDSDPCLALGSFDCCGSYGFAWVVLGELGRIGRVYWVVLGGVLDCIGSASRIGSYWVVLRQIGLCCVELGCIASCWVVFASHWVVLSRISVAVLGNRRDILIWDVQSTTKSNTKTDTKSAARRQVRTIPGSLWYSENLSDDLPPLMSSPVEPSPLSNCSTGHARTHARAATRAGVEGRGRGRRGGRVGGNGSGSCRVRGNGIRSGRVGENDAATRARHGAGAWGGLLDLPFPKVIPMH
eukprot:1319963-Amorphochlora_amoeboformis.AAC.1